MSELTTQNQAEEQGPARTVVVAEDEALIRPRHRRNSEGPGVRCCCRNR